MAHRGQWSEHEARGVLSAWRKSGSRSNGSRRSAAWCQRLRFWKAKLEGKTTVNVIPGTFNVAITLACQSCTSVTLAVEANTLTSVQVRCD